MTRKKHDFYPTPSWASVKLLEHFPMAGVIGEPCSGAGDMANELRRHNQIWTNDIDHNHAADSYYDLMDPASWDKFPDCDWIDRALVF